MKIRNLAFVIWMVCSPAVEALSVYVNEYLCGHKYSADVTGLSAIITMAFYIFVGIKLYERKEN